MLGPSRWGGHVDAHGSSFSFLLDVFSGRGYLQVCRTPPTRPFLNCLF